jgi:hypothetical protein
VGYWENEKYFTILPTIIQMQEEYEKNILIQIVGMHQLGRAELQSALSKEKIKIFEFEFSVFFVKF